MPLLVIQGSKVERILDGVHENGTNGTWAQTSQDNVLGAGYVTSSFSYYLVI